MTSIAEAIRTVFTTKASIGQLRADLALAESKLAGARGALAKAKAAHESQAPDLMTRADEGASLARSRGAIDDASDLVTDLEAAIEAAKRRLVAATEADEQSAIGDAWDRAAAILQRREVAWEASQRMLDAWLATIPGLQALNNEVWEALPVKPDNRPRSVHPKHLGPVLEQYIWAHSDGLIGRASEVPPFVARQRDSLVMLAKKLSTNLLFADPRKVKS